MSKNKRKYDMISEEDYTWQMAQADSGPENDSPGDSESDSRSEVLMGVGFEPDDNEVGYLEGELTDNAGLKRKKRSGKAETKRKYDDLSESETMVSSEMPGPWADFESTTNTH